MDEHKPLKRKSRESVVLGATYGQITVIKTAGQKAQRQWYYVGRCSCGTIKCFRGSALTTGRVKSCGCLQRKIVATTLRKPPGESGFTRLYRNYKRGAIKRNYEFNLTKNEVRQLTAAPCYYCGIAPSQIMNNKTFGVTEEGIKNSEYKYNGIDRMDNQLGYSLNNCVTCCGQCNVAKRSMSSNEFLNLILKIYNHRKLHNV